MLWMSVLSPLSSPWLKLYMEKDSNRLSINDIVKTNVVACSTIYAMVKELNGADQYK